MCRQAHTTNTILFSDQLNTVTPLFLDQQKPSFLCFRIKKTVIPLFSDKKKPSLLCFWINKNRHSSVFGSKQPSLLCVRINKNRTPLFSDQQKPYSSVFGSTKTVLLCFRINKNRHSSVFGSTKTVLLCFRINKNRTPLFSDQQKPYSSVFGSTKTVTPLFLDQQKPYSSFFGSTKTVTPLVSDQQKPYSSIFGSAKYRTPTLVSDQFNTVHTKTCFQISSNYHTNSGFRSVQTITQTLFSDQFNTIIQWTMCSTVTQCKLHSKYSSLLLTYYLHCSSCCDYITTLHFHNYYWCSNYIRIETLSTFADCHAFSRALTLIVHADGGWRCCCWRILSIVHTAATTSQSRNAATTINAAIASGLERFRLLLIAMHFLRFSIFDTFTLATVDDAVVDGFSPLFTLLHLHHNLVIPQLRLMQRLHQDWNVFELCWLPYLFAGFDTDISRYRRLTMLLLTDSLHCSSCCNCFKISSYYNYHWCSDCIRIGTFSTFADYHAISPSFDIEHLILSRCQLLIMLLLLTYYLHCSSCCQYITTSQCHNYCWCSDCIRIETLSTFADCHAFSRALTLIVHAVGGWRCCCWRILSIVHTTAPSSQSRHTTTTIDAAIASGLKRFRLLLIAIPFRGLWHYYFTLSAVDDAVVDGFSPLFKLLHLHHNLVIPQLRLMQRLHQDWNIFDFCWSPCILAVFQYLIRPLSVVRWNGQ